MNDGASLYSRQDTQLIIGDPDDAETSTLHLVNDGSKDTFIEISNRGQVIVNKNGVLTLDSNKGLRNWNINPDSDEPNKIHFLVDGGTFNGNFSSGSSGSETFRVVFRNGATFNRNIEANPVGLQGNTSVLFDNSTYNVWNKDASQNNGFGNHVINSGPNNQNMHIDVVFDNGSVVNGLGVVDSGKTSVEYYNFVDPIPTSGLSGADLTLQIGTMTAADSYFNFSLLNGSKLSAKGVLLGRNEAASSQGTYTFLIQGDSAERTAILATSGGTTINISDYEGDDSAYKMNFLMKGNAVYNSKGNFVVANTNGSSWYSFKSGDLNIAITGSNNTFNANRVYMLNNADRYEVASRASADFYFGVDDGSGNPVATNSAMSLNGISVYTGYDTNASVRIGGSTNTFTNTASFDFYGYQYEGSGSAKATIEFTNGIAFTMSQNLNMMNYVSGTNEFIVSNGANATIGGVKFNAYDNSGSTAVSSIIVDGATLTTSNNWDFDGGASGLTQIILKGDGASITSNAQMNLNYAGSGTRKFLISMEGTNGTLEAKYNLNYNGAMTNATVDSGYFINMTGSGNTLKTGTTSGGFNFNNSDSTGGTYRLYSKSDSATNKNVVNINQYELNWQGYYKSDLDPEKDAKSTAKTEVILAGNTKFITSDTSHDGRIYLKLGEFSGRQFWGGDLLLEINGSGNEIYLDGLIVGNGYRLAGEDRVRIVGGGSVIDVNTLRMMRGAETSVANPVGGVLEYQLDDTGISPIVINNGIDNQLSGILKVDFTGMRGNYEDERFVLMTAKVSNLETYLSQYWYDFNSQEVLDNMEVIARGLEDEKIEFAVEDSSTLSGYKEFIVYYTGTAIIPEPATCAAILGALALAFAAYRRRK